MKRKYVIRLTVLATLIVLDFILQLSYELWKIETKSSELAITESGCVEIIYSDDKTFNLINPISVKDVDGIRTIPKSISINNKCADIKTISVTFDILANSNLDSSKIKVLINGDENVDAIPLSDVKELKNNEPSIKEKRLVYKYDMAPDSTSRLNIRLWLDEDYAISEEHNAFYANYYVTAQEQVIKPSIYEKVITDNGGSQVIALKGTPDYNNITDYNGLYKIHDSYYFRGNVNNNYIKLNDLLFRIVGINADKSLKVVYVNNDLISKFSDNNYIQSNVSLLGSPIENILNNWYEVHLQGLNEYIVNHNYCIDTSSTAYYNKITFGAGYRLLENNIPSIDCAVSNREYGGIYNNKIGLLTLDELVIAGANKDKPNNNFYLFTGNNYYTISPTKFYYTGYVGILDNSGKISESLLTSDRVIMPVININGNLKLKGNGTIDVPYELDFEE